MPAKIIATKYQHRTGAVPENRKTKAAKKPASVARSSPNNGVSVQVFAHRKPPSLGLGIVRQLGDVSPGEVFPRAHGAEVERIEESGEVDPPLG